MATGAQPDPEPLPAPAIAPGALTRAARAGTRRSALLLFLALFAVYATGVGLHSRPGSDLRPSEAHILLSAESLVSDGDFELSDEYSQRSWAGFYEGELRPNALTLSGRLVEVQGLAFPALVAPAYALGGRIAVQLMLAALAALGFVLGAALARRLVPDPWASAAALAIGLSPPAVIAATTISPTALSATLIAGSAALALQVRDWPRGLPAAGCAALLAVVPWISPPALPVAAVVAAALFRWLRRRRRAWTGLVAIEIVFVSLIVWVSVNRVLFGGLTPYSASELPHAPTGADGLAEYLERAPRLAGVLIDSQVGVLLYAPVLALAGATLWGLWVRHRDRLTHAFPGQVDVEVAAGLVAALCAAAIVTAVVLTPTLDGRFPGEPLVVALPCAAALCAWSLRERRALALALTLVGVVLTTLVLVIPRVDDRAAVSPVQRVPWSMLGSGDALR